MSKQAERRNNLTKILILVDWFIPGFKAGGPIQSCANVAFALKDDFSISVLTTDTDYGENVPYANILPNKWTTELYPGISVYYANAKMLTFNQIKKVLLESNANFIYLNHLFSPKFVVYPLWLKWRGLLKKKIVVCPRGALYDSALTIKKYKKAPFLKVFKLMGIHKMVRFHATNEREKKVILKFFPGSEVFIADNLPNMNQPEFHDLEKTSGHLKCVFIARIHPIKNLYFLLQVLQSVKANVFLTIIGPLEDEGYWKKCSEFINTLPDNIKVQYEGPVPNIKLINHLQANHLFVLPTTGENFGHAIFESFLAGRPVLISDQTPWQQLNSLGVGWEHPLNELPYFVDAIESAAQWDQDAFNFHAMESWKYARSFINNPSLKSQYLELFHE